MLQTGILAVLLHTPKITLCLGNKMLLLRATLRRGHPRVVPSQHPQTARVAALCQATAMLGQQEPRALPQPWQAGLSGGSPLPAQHWQFVCCEGEAAAVLLGLQEDKSPFMAAWSTELSCQHGTERGGLSPGAPHSLGSTAHPPPCTSKPWHEGHHMALTQSTEP